MLTGIHSSTGTEFGSWEAWTTALSFELDRCHVLLAVDVNNDQHIDLICPYVNSDGSTVTYVQRVILYRVMLPIVMH